MIKNENTAIINKVRQQLYNNIYSKKDFTDVINEEQKIENLILSTINNGESNSALILGPRGSGKTSLINKILDKTIAKNNSNSLLVRLHGLIHTNDNLALKSITYQLNLSNVVEGKVFGSFAENLSFLIASLRSGHKSSTKSIIFILDEFDLFCSHHNQTLLYNLFDISQSAETPLCVLGITSRLDVIELLEKRIKSRFSSRQIFLFPSSDNEIQVLLDEKTKIIKNLLSITKNEKIPSSFQKKWNGHISDLIESKRFQSVIERFLEIDISRASLNNSLVLIISNLRKDDDIIKVTDFEEQLKIYESDEIVKVLKDLNVLEICLIIAMKHHYEIYEQPMNFEMIFTRYVKFATAHSLLQSINRPVVMKAFEHIQNLELITFLNMASSKLQKEYQLFNLAATNEQIKEALKGISGLSTEIVQWASSSFV